MILKLKLHHDQDIIVAGQLKAIVDQLTTRGRWNATVARKWVTWLGTLDFEAMMFSMVKSKTNHI